MSSSAAATRLFDAVVDHCAARGMNLVAAVDAAAFDATQPAGRRAGDWLPCAGTDGAVAAGTVLLLGTGGRSGWEALRRRLGPGSIRARPGHHPIDDWSTDIADEVRRLLDAAGVAATVVRPDDRHTLNFRQLGEMAGLGVISPVIGHLLHPVYGPWVSLRAALVVEGAPFGPRPPSTPADFEPCNACSKPCVAACPAGVYDDEDRPDLVRCADWRIAGGCNGRCESLRACPIGREHRYSEEEEAFRQAYSMFRIRRWRGVGGWRLVPGFLRRRW